MCKLYQISKEAYKKCEIEIIDDDKYFSINKRDLEIESDYSKREVIFDKCDPEKQKYRQELIPNTKFQQSRLLKWFSWKKFKSRRLSSKKFLEFKEKLGLDPNKYSFDEQDIISAKQRTWSLLF